MTEAATLTHRTTKQVLTPPQDRIERLADRVLAVAKAIVAQGDGRTFTADTIYDAMPDVNRQHIKDAIKTLKDNRSIHAFGSGRGVRGIYELEESFPAARIISMSTLSDGWRLIEVGDTTALAVTPQEAAIIGSYLAGDAVRISLAEKMRMFQMELDQVRHENATLKQSIRRLRGGA